MYQTFLKPLFSDIKTFVLDTLFPISCLSCGKEGDFICADCKITLTELEHQRCIVCQKPTPFGLTHSLCQTPHGANALISFYDYHDEKMAKIIIGGKYNFLPGVYKILAGMIAEKIQTNFTSLLQANSYFLIPIPLHPFRRRWRGFNQAEILAQELGQNLSFPCTSVLVRCKLTKTQKDLKKDQRTKNMTGAFELKKDADVRGKNIILVDDVTTTSATLQEAAKVLKRNGAANVICLTVARD